MILEDIFEAAVSVEKTVWQKRGDKVTRKEVSRLLATAESSPPKKETTHGR
jgi:hypothetical protein